MRAKPGTKQSTGPPAPLACAEIQTKNCSLLFARRQKD